MAIAIEKVRTRITLKKVIEKGSSKYCNIRKSDTIWLDRCITLREREHLLEIFKKGI